MDSCLSWIARAPFSLLLLCAPVLYWWTGICTLQATLPELVYWMLSALVSNYIFMTLVSDKKVLPVVTDVSQLLPAFTICGTVVSTLIRPWGRPFKVRPKGISTSSVTVQWRFLSGFAVIAILTVLGLALHISSFNSLLSNSGYTLNIIVSLSNVGVLSLVIAACVERPRRRRDERFRSNQRMMVRVGDGEMVGARLRDISVGGASVSGLHSLIGTHKEGEFYLPGANLLLPFSVVKRAGGTLAIKFNLSDSLRRALITELFTGKYENEVHQVRAASVFLALTKAVFG